jgi:hypothetical protein
MLEASRGSEALWFSLLALSSLYLDSNKAGVYRVKALRSLQDIVAYGNISQALGPTLLLLQYAVSF